MSESVSGTLVRFRIALRLPHDEVVVHLVVAQQSGARGIETVVDDAARRVEPTAGEAGQIEQQGDPFTIYSQPASVFASDFLGKANLLSGVLACEDGVWCVCSENVRIPVNHVGGREGDTVKTAVRGEYFEFCTPETEGANPFHLEKKIFTGLSWKLIGTLGTQPLDISALGTHAGTLSEGDDLFVRIRPENVVYYNNN